MRGLSHPRGGRFGRFLQDGARHGSRGRHEGGRAFEQGELRWVFLKLISERASHGYELIKAIEERMGGAYSPSPGVVYPTLTLLDELGLIAAIHSEGPKKAFGITPDGAKALDENRAIVEGILERMEAVAERSGGGPAPQIVRGMENLRTALRLKLEQGKLTETQVADIAKALDTAAESVEKS